MGYPQPPGSFSPYASAPVAYDSGPDIAGVDHLRIASILGLVVQAMLWIGFAIIYLIFSALSNFAPTIGTRAGTFPSWITPNTLYAVIGLLAAGLVIGIVAYIFFFLGFRDVKRGAPDFGAPTTLVFIGLIGFAMMALGVLVVVGTLAAAVNSAISGTVTGGTASVTLGALLGGLALIGLGAVLALIGVIGLIIGNWRAGSRYGESMLKAGAILTILPYVSIVGYVLLVVGYSSAAKKIRSGWRPAPMVVAQVYYPPPAVPAPSWQAPPPPPP